MISERKLAANRRNASRSSGPRTLRGKSRSSRNAVRHGLAVPLSNDPVRLYEIEQLAKMLSASSNDLLRQDEARELAECHFDLRRIRSAKAAVLQHLGSFDNPDVEAHAAAAEALDKISRYESRVLARRRKLLAAKDKSNERQN